MNINKVLSEFKEGIINSKKYWIIYLAFILIAALSIMNIENFMNPKLEIITILILSLSGILCISHFHIHKSDKELYKTAFIKFDIFRAFSDSQILFLQISRKRQDKKKNKKRTKKTGS